MVEHPLRGEVPLHLVPDQVAQVLLRDVRPDPERRREFDQMQPVGDHQHAVDGHLYADDVVDEAGAAGSEGTGHDYLFKHLLVEVPGQLGVNTGVGRFGG